MNGRSKKNDAKYLEEVRKAYEIGLPHWSRYRRHFKTLIEDYLKLEITDIAWANLAKCRVPIDKGNVARKAEQRLTKLCQEEFAPLGRLVNRLRPVAVLLAVLKAGSNGNIVEWNTSEWNPLVYSWQGQSGHDRHNTDPEARRLTEWAQEMALQVKSRSSLLENS